MKRSSARWERGSGPPMKFSQNRSFSSVLAKASTLLDWVRGTQGNFEDRCKVVPTMVNAIRLHASKIVPIDLKSVRPFETKIMRTMLGNSRLGRAKEIVFSILGASNRISPSLLILYSWATWLVRLCKARGPSLITAQCIWGCKPNTRRSGPFGRALHTLHAKGW